MSDCHGTQTALFLVSPLGDTLTVSSFRQASKLMVGQEGGRFQNSILAESEENEEK